MCVFVCVVKQQANAASQCHHQHQHIHLSQPNINIACRGRSLPNVNQMSSNSGIDLQVLSCVHAIHDHHHSHFRLLIPSWHAQLDLCRHTLEQTINERNSQSEMQTVEHMMWRRKTSGCCDTKNLSLYCLSVTLPNACWFKKNLPCESAVNCKILAYYLQLFLFFLDIVPSVLWRCWLGGRKGIRPVKNWVVRCWCGYLSGTRCRLAYGPADATATHCLLLQ